MKSKMTKRAGVNNGMPCLEKICRSPRYNGNYCSACGWHHKYHTGNGPSYSSHGSVYTDDSASDVAEIAADVGSIVGAAMDIFGGGDSGGSSDDYSSNDSGSSNDDDNSGGDFGGGGSDSGW